MRDNSAGFESGHASEQPESAISRRQFVRNTTLALSGLSLLGPAFPASKGFELGAVPAGLTAPEDVSVIGLYGRWAASLVGDTPPSLSFRRKESTDLDAWRRAALSSRAGTSGDPGDRTRPAGEGREKVHL